MRVGGGPDQGVIDGLARSVAASTWRILAVGPGERASVEKAARRAAVILLAAARPSERHAWYEAAARAIESVARTSARFTSDEVWAEIERSEGGLVPPDPRAMGIAFGAAQRRGLIAPTQETRPSRRRVNHGRPVRVWQPVR